MKYYIGSTPYLEAKVYNSSSTLVDTGTSITIEISDPSGKIIIDDVAMTSSGTTGIYYYAGLTLATSHLEGKWTWRVKETTSSIVSTAESEFEFVKR
jgi:hypothetical protein